jgi:OOP family OmpA-OmpF porin
VAAVLIAILVIGFFVHRRNARWNDYLAKLQNHPGIVVTGSQKHWGHYTLTGMRDPLAADPVQMATEFGIAPGSLEIRFEPYQSLDASFARPREFEAEKQQLEQQIVLFPVNSSALTSEQGMRLDAIEDHINRLQEIAGELGQQIHITIYGRADQTGAETKNAALSKERAQRVLEALRERGIPSDMLTAVGLGDSEPIRHGSPAYQLEVNRSVSLKVQSQHQGDKP